MKTKMIILAITILSLISITTYSQCRYERKSIDPMDISIIKTMHTVMFGDMKKHKIEKHDNDNLECFLVKAAGLNTMNDLSYEDKIDEVEMFLIKAASFNTPIESNVEEIDLSSLMYKTSDFE